MNNEVRGWDSIDEYLLLLEWLDDDQTVRECQNQLEKHGDSARCDIDHPIEQCFVPTITAAVKAILSIYEKKSGLHPNSRYVLEHYLALSHEGRILVDTEGHDPKGSDKP